MEPEGQNHMVARLIVSMCLCGCAECWRCAKYLTSLLERMGASVKMVRHDHSLTYPYISYPYMYVY